MAASVRSEAPRYCLRTETGSIFLDFGKNFDLEARYFDAPFNSPFHIPSLLRIGALPAIDGLYRTKPGRPVDGVVVSHPHLDHCGYVPLLSPQIPVFAGEDTAELILIRSETQNQGWANDYSQTVWRTFRGVEVVQVEGTDIAFVPFPVDHSVPGSYAFIVEAGGKRIAYTGDIRMHGRQPERTHAFMRLLKEPEIDVLICEGTHVTPEAGDPQASFLRQAGDFLAAGLRDAARHPLDIS